MNKLPWQEKMMRRRQVRQETGWSDKYIGVLVRSGRLHAWRPYPQAQGWYYREEVNNLLAAATRTNP